MRWPAFPAAIVSSEPGRRSTSCCWTISEIGRAKLLLSRLGGSLARSRPLDEPPHARQPDRLPTLIRLAVAHADRLAPVGRLVAELVEKGRRLLRAAFDELARVATDGRELFLPMVADVEHKGGLGCELQVHAVVVVNPQRVPGLARHVGLRQLGPEAGILNELRRRDVIRMSIDPVRGQ